MLEVMTGNNGRKRLESLSPLTCVQSDTYPDRNVRHVPHFEGSHGAQDVEGHVSYLCSVAVAVRDGKT